MNVMVTGLLAGITGSRKSALVTGIVTTVMVLILGRDVSGIAAVSLLAGVLTCAWAWLVSSAVQAILATRQRESE